MTEKEKDIGIKYFTSFYCKPLFDEQLHKCLFCLIFVLVPLYYMYQYHMAGYDLVIAQSWKLFGYECIFFVSFIIFITFIWEYINLRITFSKNKILSNFYMKEVSLKNLNAFLPNFKVIAIDDKGDMESANIANEFSRDFESKEAVVKGYLYTYKYKGKSYSVAYPKSELENAICC